MKGMLAEYGPDLLPEDPNQRAAAKQGMLAAGAAMLANRGQNFFGSAGEALGAGTQVYQGALQQQQKDQFEQAQLRLLQNKDTRDQRNNSLIMSAFGPPPSQQPPAGAFRAPDLSNVPMMSRPGSGPMSGQPPSAGAPSGPNAAFPMSLNQVAMLKALGVADLTEPYKMANEGFKREQGATYQMPDGSVQSFAKLDNGQVQGADGSVSNAAGYIAATGEVENAKARAKAGAEADYDLLPMAYIGEDGNPIGGTRGDYVRRTVRQLPQKPPAGEPVKLPPVRVPGAGKFPTVSSEEQKGRDDDRLHILRSELAATRNPADIAALQREIAGVTRSMGGSAGASPVRLQSPAAARMQMGAVDTNVKLDQDLNSNWITQVHNPVQAEGKAARATLGQIETLKNINFQGGWGAQQRSTAANMLAMLGVKDAEKFATSAQQFQQVAMERNMTMLQAQSGPQTDGDSERAQKTFVQLSNTPEANNFIAALTAANARISAQKADYYMKAMPLARARGDMTEIDRRWARVSPSVWSDPALAKYKVK